MRLADTGGAAGNELGVLMGGAYLGYEVTRYIYGWYRSL